MTEEGAGVALRALIGPGIVAEIFGLLFLIAALDRFLKAHRSWLSGRWTLCPRRWLGGSSR